MKLKMKALAAAAALALRPATAQAQISGNVVKIGILNDQSSLYADLAGQGSVSPRRWRSRTSRRKEKGLNVEVIFADHQNKADVGSQIANKWIDSEGVDVIVDVPNSGVALAVNEIVKDKRQGVHQLRRGVLGPHRRKCSPNTVHWTYDTWMLANGTGSAIVKSGGDSWYFLTADYAFGHALERDTEAVVLKDGGKVVGKVRAPINTQDFSVLPAAGAVFQGQDRRPRQRRRRHHQLDQAGGEFGIVKGGQNLAGLLVFLSDVHGLGLDKAQGLILTNTFYWDLNDQTRAWSKNSPPPTATSTRRWCRQACMPACCITSRRSRPPRPMTAPRSWPR
jgi:branched-chain amino acid transport system substrate-binding protein